MKSAIEFVDAPGFHSRVNGEKMFVAEPTVVARPKQRETAFGYPRDFLNNRFVYAVISPRARGLSIGVNLNPGKACSFDCAYCEVGRSPPGVEESLDLEAMARELQNTLGLVRSGRIREFSFFKSIPEELLQLRHVALSGNGEPTLCPNFTEAVLKVAHVRARCPSFFKIVLTTNATGLDLPEVQRGLKYFTGQDEIWAKLDAGTQEYFGQVNCADISLEKILANILSQARQRPVVIQSLFPSLNGREPSPKEILEYARRLKNLKEAGAQIPLVQIYSATRPMRRSDCGHLPLKTLSRIAQTVRQTAGLNAEIF